jgi:outer membrane biosynthesis protein TonB
MESSVDSTKEPGEVLEQGKLASSNKEEVEFLETEKKIALNEESPISKNTGEKENKGLEEQKKTIVNNQPDPDAIKQKPQDEKKKKRESQPKSQPKTAENKRASQNAEKGFRSEAKATVMEGSISRRSKTASKDVKATPVGKYMAQVSKLVEQEWQRRVMMHADLIQPGTLRIGFMVDERGRVKNINTIARTMGSENQLSLTYQALTSVKIPPMPKKVKNSQGGDLLEFRYHFNFQ